MRRIERQSVKFSAIEPGPGRPPLESFGPPMLLALPVTRFNAGWVKSDR
jgi:hypothetical protein